MRNSGELKLKLPALPRGNRGWQWKLSVNEERAHSGGPAKQYARSSYFTIIVADGIEDECWFGSEEEISMDWDYDKIIAAVQRQIDDLYDRFINRDVAEKTPVDAVKHIWETFSKSAVPAQPNWAKYFETY